MRERAAATASSRILGWELGRVEVTVAKTGSSVSVGLAKSGRSEPLTSTRTAPSIYFF